MGMNLVKLRMLESFWRQHPDARGALLRWHGAARKASWTCLKDVRKDIPSADTATVSSGRSVVVFNIGGNKYRLITAIHYNRRQVFVMKFPTHAEYEQKPLEGRPMTTRAIDKDGKPMPTTYAGLVKLWRPVMIHSDAEMERAYKIVEQLAGFDLTPEQEEYLDLVATLVSLYDKSKINEAEWRVPPLQHLKELLQENGMSASDLGRLLGSRALGPAILNGRRQLSKAHILKLAERFQVNPGLFLEQPASKPSRRAKPRLRTGGAGSKTGR